MAAGLLLAACGNDTPEPVTETPDVAVLPDVGEAASLITCENACDRAPRCEGTLVTKADCIALCEAEANPDIFACCLQYASGCSAIKGCLEGWARTCEPEGNPWVPLAMFEKCECGDGGIPNTHECKETGPDHPCPTETVCIKPANSGDAPFCAVDCTLNPTGCPEGTHCEKTPKSNYCRKLF